MDKENVVHIYNVSAIKKQKVKSFAGNGWN
jgi:hypothetical protein